MTIISSVIFWRRCDPLEGGHCDGSHRRLLLWIDAANWYGHRCGTSFNLIGTALSLLGMIVLRASGMRRGSQDFQFLFVLSLVPSGINTWSYCYRGSGRHCRVTVVRLLLCELLLV